MKNEEPENGNSIVFSHPTQSKMFMFAKKQPENTVGVRELQRELKIKSISTVVWHLDKLQDSGMITKLPTNKYQLTNKGVSLENFDISLGVGVKYVAGTLQTKYAFSLGFLIASLIIYTWMFFNTINPLVMYIYGMLALFLSVGIHFIQFMTFRSQITQLVN